MLLFCLNTAKGQINQSYLQLILGTWVKEGETIDYRWEFNQQGTINMFDENQIYARFNWQIVTEQVLNGLTINSLTLTNVDDPSQELIMEIGCINSQEMYLRSPNVPIRFVRQ